MYEELLRTSAKNSDIATVKYLISTVQVEPSIAKDELIGLVKHLVH